MNVLTVTDRLARRPAHRTLCHGAVFESRAAFDGRPRLWVGFQCWGRLVGRAAHHLDADRDAAGEAAA
jgi:hypothetical protein